MIRMVDKDGDGQVSHQTYVLLLRLCLKVERAQFSHCGSLQLYVKLGTPVFSRGDAGTLGI